MPNFFIPVNCDSLPFGRYNTRTLSEIFPDVDLFKQGYEDSGMAISSNRISDEYVEVLYWLLMSQHRNDHPKMSDENRFKADIYSVIFMYGPTWEARLKAQKEIRDLLGTDALFDGSMTVYNTSTTPSTPPSTDAFAPLPTINGQNANKWTKGKLEAYGALMEVLKTDCTSSFMAKFDKLFKPFNLPDSPLFYTITPEQQEVVFDDKY